MLLCIWFMPELFSIEKVTLKAAMLLGVFLIATEGLFRYIYNLCSGLGTLSGNLERRKEEKKQKRREERREKVRAKRQALEEMEADESMDYFDGE